jgi:hypothetical protein
MKFYLGSHVLNHINKSQVPMFISFRTLRKRKRKRFDNKIALCVDSGGFSELSLFGKWTITPEQYSKELLRLKNLGLNFNWCAIQDYMCEPHIIEKTGLTIKEHQKRTIENYLKMTSFKDGINYIPVIQGYELNDYLECVKMYKSYGIDLTEFETVGVGSVCRRQSSDEIYHIMKELYSLGLNLHGFGVKSSGLKKYGKYLVSADSLAWSFNARYNKERCLICKNFQSKTKNCANCLNYALDWRKKILLKSGLLI